MVSAVSHPDSQNPCMPRLCALQTDDCSTPGQRYWDEDTDEHADVLHCSRANIRVQMQFICKQSSGIKRFDDLVLCFDDLVLWDFHWLQIFKHRDTGAERGRQCVMATQGWYTFVSLLCR